MIKQKTEEMQLEGSDPLKSPSSKRKNESTLRQLQNDVMGKARSTLSTLGDVLKGGKNVSGNLSAPNQVQDQQLKHLTGEASSEGSEQQFATPPRSPKTPKDKSSIDFFPWSKSKGKDNSKNTKREKIKTQQSQLSDVHEEDIEDDDNKNSSGANIILPKSGKPGPTGTVKKKSINDSSTVRHQYQQQKSKYSTDYVESSDEFRYENEYSRSLEDGIQYLSRESIHGNEKYYECRPKSYNEKYAQNTEFMYNLNENPEYIEQSEYGTKGNRKISNFSSPSSSKHILFNEENDILYYKDNHRPSKSKVTGDHARDKQKGTPVKVSTARDTRKMQDVTPIPIRKVSKDEKPNIPISSNAAISQTNTEIFTPKPSSKFQRTIGNSDDNVKNTQRSSSARVPLARGYSVDCRDNHKQDSSKYGEANDVRSIRDNQFENELNDRRCSKKICFQEPTYDNRNKCETLPRSRKTTKKIDADKVANEYLDFDMLRPRSGSLDSDLESQAMRIVRTVGQAFEVCHKLSMQDSGGGMDEHSETSNCDFSEQDRGSDKISEDGDYKKDIAVEVEELPQMNTATNLDSQILSQQKPTLQDQEKDHISDKTPLSTSSEIVSLKEQLEQQQIQCRQIVAQLVLVREQLITETNARIEAQARNQQLLQQNRELLEHIASLGGYHEPDRPGMSTAIGLAPQYSLFQSHQGLGDILNIGGLGSHFASVQHLNSANQSTMAAMQQPINNNTTSTYSLMNKQHNMNPNVQNVNNIMGTQVASLAAQEFYRLNQNILNQLTNPSYGSVYPSISQCNSNASQLPSKGFVFANQNATGFNNNSKITAEGTITNKSEDKGKIEASVHQGKNVPNNTISKVLSKSEHGIDDGKQDENSTSSEDSQFIKPLSQVGTLTTLDADGKIKVIVPVNCNEQLIVPSMMGRKSTSFSEISGTASTESSTKNMTTNKESREKKSSIPSLVTLKVTDESGAVTRRLPATPSFITRTTSEKVPNRSQIMSQVQRTQWARHTTK